MKTFNSQEEADVFLRDRIGSALEVSHECAIAISDALRLSKKEEVRVPPGGSPALVKRFRWVIRDDDLGLLDSVIDTARALATAGFLLISVPDAATVAGAVGVIAAAAKLSRNALQRGAQLDVDCFAVLLRLKEHGPKTIEELLVDLNKADPRSLEWTLPHVKACLDSLTQVAASDGAAKQLVRCDSNGSWRTVGV